MEDLIKKFFYTGVGLVSLTAEKLQDSVKKLVDEDKIGLDEGRKLVDEIMDKTNSKRIEFERNIKKVTEDLAEKFSFSKNKNTADILARLEVIEEKLGIKAEKEMPLVKKAPTRKKTVKSMAKDVVDEVADTAEQAVKDASKSVDAAAKKVSKTSKTTARRATKAVKDVKKKAEKLIDETAHTLEEVSHKGEEVVDQMKQEAKKGLEKVESAL